MRTSAEAQRALRRPSPRAATGAWLAFFGLTACSFDRGDRWIPRDEPAAICKAGEKRCVGTTIQECTDGGGQPDWEQARDCADNDLVCAVNLVECTSCQPGSSRCAGSTVERCRDDGSGFDPGAHCEASEGTACRDGACVNLCARAREQRSNVGCEYWAADLDNADIDASLNAAAQQFAVVLSNPEPDVVAKVTIEQDDTHVGEDNAPFEIARATLPPLSLQVFKLGPREVDGSPRGTFDTGTNTALTRTAYRIRATAPVVAYQFNPLENVNVFSNDASLLKPVEALTFIDGDLATAYAVLGWPQTIARADDPDQNFNDGTQDLRAFLTIVGTRPDTRVRVTPRARIVAGDPIAETDAGDTLELHLDPFDVANLETGGFNADFTGSIIEADRPVVVFSGSEASDAPAFRTLADRRCCADHLEEQLDPVRTAGKRFVATVSPNRSRAIADAGASIEAVEAPEFFRVIAATEAGAHISTTLLGDDASLELDGLGDFVEITAKHHFMIESNEPVMLSSVSPSQEAAGVPRGLPGGDPSFLVVPPIEQFRRSYVFLTPDRYSFDFIRVIAPAGAEVRFDGEDITRLSGCTRAAADGLSRATRGGAAPFVVHTCQLSFPLIDPSLGANEPLRPGDQNDGVHEVLASTPVGLVVNGFDRNVSYAYAGGTELATIVPR